MVHSTTVLHVIAKKKSAIQGIATLANELYILRDQLALVSGVATILYVYYSKYNQSVRAKKHFLIKNSQVRLLENIILMKSW